jgi:hypothetical protein
MSGEHTQPHSTGDANLNAHESSSSENHTSNFTTSDSDIVMQGNGHTQVTNTFQGNVTMIVSKQEMNCPSESESGVFSGESSAAPQKQSRKRKARPSTACRPAKVPLLGDL